MPVAYKTTILRENIVALIQDGEGARWTFDQAKKVENVARVIVPTRTGRLRDSHRTLRLVGSNQFVSRFRVSAEAPYALYVYHGTGIYGPLHRPIIGWQKLPFDAIDAFGHGRNAGKGSVVYSTKGQVGKPWLEEAAAIALHV